MKRTIKLVAALLVILCAVSSLSACTSGKPSVKKGTKADKQENIIGSTEDIMRTYWFEYTINSAETAESAGSLVPAEGNVFVKLDTTFTNISDSELQINSREFICYYATEENSYTTCLTASDIEGLMPETITLQPEESATYALIYEIPASTQRVEIGFVEYFANDTYGDKFYVDIALEEKK